MKSSKTIDFESIFEFSRKEVDKQKHYYDAVALKNTEKVIAAFLSRMMVKMEWADF